MLPLEQGPFGYPGEFLLYLYGWLKYQRAGMVSVEYRYFYQYTGVGQESEIMKKITDADLFQQAVPSAQDNLLLTLTGKQLIEL